MEMNFPSECKLDLAAAGASSAGTAVDGSAIDMQGYDAICFFCTIATANAGNFLKASQAADSGGSPDDFSDIAGSKVVAATNGDVVMLNIRRPLKRYVKPHIIRAGTNTATGDIYAVRYNSRKGLQVNAVTNVVALVELNGPAEGTA
jgi:hypothetical protein